ncbi:C-type lectin lectoxin-Enh5-like [Sander lucioperca]|uniref:C-type lectin lectoxin-Enh5-like n=1 Tax=Sander lucioperca TaxID=283035 RepID=UPI0016535B0D|nr:C-type lectin lectoxin-Enh5-like [Sander lucioperca]
MQWSLLVLIVMGQCSSIGGQLCDYHFIGKNMTWKEAQDYCRKNHTDLATVSNQTDMQRLLESTTEQYQGGAWIGLQNNTTNTVCRWRWSQPGVEFNVTESKWSQGQPDNLGNQENCVMMNGGTWHDDSCSTKYNFICYEGLLHQEDDEGEEEEPGDRNEAGEPLTQQRLASPSLS